MSDSWCCSRCGRSHSLFVPTCHCSPPVGTTTFANFSTESCCEKDAMPQAALNLLSEKDTELAELLARAEKAEAVLVTIAQFADPIYESNAVSYLRAVTRWASSALAGRKP